MTGGIKVEVVRSAGSRRDNHPVAETREETWCPRHLRRLEVEADANDRSSCSVWATGSCYYIFVRAAGADGASDADTRKTAVLPLTVTVTW